MRTGFELRQPCTNCPFRKGMGERFNLRPDRLTEIWLGNGFTCHKTAAYDGEEDEDGNPIQPVHNPKKQECAGFMALKARECDPTLMMRIMEDCGWLDFAELDPKREVYDDWAAVFAAHMKLPDGVTP